MIVYADGIDRELLAGGTLPWSADWQVKGNLKWEVDPGSCWLKQAECVLNSRPCLEALYVSIGGDNARPIQVCKLFEGGKDYQETRPTIKTAPLAIQDGLYNGRASRIDSPRRRNRGRR